MRNGVTRAVVRKYGIDLGDIRIGLNYTIFFSFFVEKLKIYREDKLIGCVSLIYH